MKVKKYLLTVAIFLTACGGKYSLSPQTHSQISLSWSNTCPSCSFQLYRTDGVCPSSLSGSPGWMVLTSTKEQSYTDTNLTSGKIYSYDVEQYSGTDFSGPSNCVTKTAP